MDRLPAVIEDARPQDGEPAASLPGAVVAVLRPLLDVGQDTRLHNVAWSLAQGGAKVTVFHLGREAETEEHVDSRGVRWVAVPNRGLGMGSATTTRSARRAWRPLGGATVAERRIRARRRALRRAEAEQSLALGRGSGVPVRLERLRLQVLGRTLKVQDRAFAAFWHRFDRVQNGSTAFVSWRRQVPDLYAFELAFGPLLDDLAPDVIHAHDLPVLGVAVRAKRRAQLTGRSPVVVWDSIEDWAGLPHHSTINARYLASMLDYEREYVRDVDAAITVSRTVAEALVSRHSRLAEPTIVMSCPRMNETEPAEQPLRTVIGLAPDVPLMLYSGGVNPARGVDVSIDALVHLPAWHLAVVTVPFPHSLEPELCERATALGVGDRVHFAPPVPGPQIVDYLSSADIGLIPISTRFANLRAAMPNKLFEYLNARLPVVVSDCREMAEFVTAHEVGSVFTYPDAVGLARAVEQAHQRHPDGLGADDLARLDGLIDWSRQETALVGLYARLLEGRP